MIKISPNDHKLIDQLRLNARVKITDLARALKVSRSTAQKRLERLEQAKVIEGYTVILSPEYLEQEIKAHVAITVLPRMTREIVDAMSNIKEIMTVHSVSGPFDLIAEIKTFEVSRLDQVIDEIIAIQGVERTESSVILSTRLKR